MGWDPCNELSAREWDGKGMDYWHKKVMDTLKNKPTVEDFNFRSSIVDQDYEDDVKKAWDEIMSYPSRGMSREERLRQSEEEGW